MVVRGLVSWMSCRSFEEGSLWELSFEERSFEERSFEGELRMCWKKNVAASYKDVLFAGRPELKQFFELYVYSSTAVVRKDDSCDSTVYVAWVMYPLSMIYGDMTQLFIMINFSVTSRVAIKTKDY